MQRTQEDENVYYIMINLDFSAPQITIIIGAPGNNVVTKCHEYSLI